MTSNQTYPPQLTEAQLSFLVDSFTDFALAQGLIVRPHPSFVATNPQNSLATTAPVTLFPSPFPRKQFEEAREIQTACNLLYARIASDEEWLLKLSKELSIVDDFIASLYNLYIKLREAGKIRQKYSLGLFRSDYMVHTENGKAVGIRQVEFNTIASSFGALASKVSVLHRYLWCSGAIPGSPDVFNHESLPENNALEWLSEGILRAHEVYVGDAKGLTGYKQGFLPPDTSDPNHKNYGVFFVVQEGERNAFDQRWFEYHLSEVFVRVFRVTFQDIQKYASLGVDGELLYKPPFAAEGQVFEISVVYLRAGYGPGDYPTQAEWDIRYLLEESKAIKCPTVLTQLAGSKKVQQVLADPENLARFVEDQTTKDRMFNTFAAIYPMDDSEAGLKARKLAFEQPDKFVLKPQREGGGNNIYKSKIPEFLNSIDEDKWKGYILMELIKPPEVDNIVMRNGEMMKGKVVGELGVYGTIVWKDDGKGHVEVVSNSEAGFLLRTKGSESEEGGVAAGFGCIDSVLLVD